MSGHDFHPDDDDPSFGVNALDPYSRQPKGLGCLDLRFGSSRISFHQLTPEQMIDLGKRIQTAGAELANRMQIERNRIADTAAFRAANAEPSDKIPVPEQIAMNAGKCLAWQCENPANATGYCVGHDTGMEAADRPIEATAVAAKKKTERYVIVRTQSAGVFAGLLESRAGQEVVMRQARRLWYWAGAASLSELANRGTSKPGQCKFPVAVDRVELLQVIEILDVTDEARASIEGVTTWSE